ncbi:MAG TPA: hypothetical protein VLI04_00760 [Nocardioidaceae bacterium]|nr:hypothetical protein [Nocardioidaceae bacterium]
MATGHDVSFWRTVKWDIASTVDDAGRTRAQYLTMVAGKILIGPQVHAVFVYRVSTLLWRWRLYPFAMMLRYLTLVLWGMEIHPGATIGPGLCVVHTGGVLIGRGTVLGSNCRLAQGTNIGEMGRVSRKGFGRVPVLGDNVTVGTHSIIAGPVTIGDGAVIGALSVVTIDIPADAVAGGVPARILRENAGYSSLGYDDGGPS